MARRADPIQTRADAATAGRAEAEFRRIDLRRYRHDPDLAEALKDARSALAAARRALGQR